MYFVRKVYINTMFTIGTKGRSQLPSYVDKYLEGKLKVDEFITHNFPIEKIVDAFHVMHKGEAIRPVVHFT